MYIAAKYGHLEMLDECKSRRGRGSGEPSPGADVAGASPVPAQMWQGEPSPSVDVAVASPGPAQIWQGCAPEDEQRARATALRFVEVRRVLYSAKCSVALSHGQLCSTWPCNAVPMRVLGCMCCRRDPCRALLFCRRHCLHRIALSTLEYPE